MRPQIRIAAAADVHAEPGRSDRVTAAFAALDGVDLVLLAGDLTTHGEPEEAEVLADACRGLDTPVLAVLGNHDWHADRTHELVAVLTDAGVRVLERSTTVVDANGVDVGVVGLKGFVGGFPDASLPDFGEPLLRQVYAATSDDVEALDRGLAEIDGSDVRVVLLHYAPTVTTLGAEPRGIWAFLGSDRLARPIARHAPDLVVHGHAHAGNFQGSVGVVPVYNVAVHVTGRDFWIFELDGGGSARAAVSREAGGRSGRSSGRVP